MRVQLFVLIVLFALLAHVDGHASNNYNAVMQNESAATPDSMIISEGYKVLFHPVEDEERFDELHEAYKLYNPAQPQVVTSLDSAKVFFKSDVKLEFQTYLWDSQAISYIRGLIARNGMKVIFRDLISFQKYYPDDDVIVLSNGTDWIINLKTGEDDCDPQYVGYSQNRHFRSALWVNSEEVSKFELQFYDKRKKCYRTLANLYKFIERRSFAKNDYFWLGDTLYLWADSALIEITVTKSDKKSKKK